MDSLFGIKGKDFIMVASESTIMNSIFKLKSQKDKSYQLDDKVLLSVSGQISDQDVFGDFIARNVQYIKFRESKSLTVQEIANFTQRELATAIRKSPVQLQSLISGFDDIRGAQLYWLDYLGTMQ